MVADLDQVRCDWLRRSRFVPLRAAVGENRWRVHELFRR